MARYENKNARRRGRFEVTYFDMPLVVEPLTTTACRSIVSSYGSSRSSFPVERTKRKRVTTHEKVFSGRPIYTTTTTTTTGVRDGGCAACQGGGGTKRTNARTSLEKRYACGGYVRYGSSTRFDDRSCVVFCGVSPRTGTPTTIPTCLI